MPEKITQALAGAVFTTEADELKAAQAFDANSTTALRTYLSNGSEMFTHSNRLNDGRIKSAGLSRYATMGDITAESEGMDGCLDIGGSAGLSKLRKALLQPYKLDGEDTCLGRSIIHNRPAGRWLTEINTGSAVKSDSYLSALDKLTLFPIVGVTDYMAIAPTTPAFRFPALLKAARTVAREAAQLDLDHHLAVASEKNAGKKDGAPATMKKKLTEMPARLSSVMFQARSYNISKAVNFSQQLSEAGGLIMQPVFVPPSGAKPFDKTLTGWRKGIALYDQLPSQAIDHVTRNAFKTSMVIRRLARQRQRHQQTKQDEQINNAETRHAYRDYGLECASESLLLKEALITSAPTPEDKNLIEALFEKHMSESLYRAIENSAFKAISKHYRLNDDRSHFLKGFNLGKYGATISSRQSPVKHPISASHKYQKGDQPQREGKFLALRLSAVDADLGSTHLCVGSLSITALHGLLHRVIERECGVSFQRFYPVFHRVTLNDLSHSKRGTSSTLWKADLGKCIDDDNLALDAYKPSFRTLAGAKPGSPGASGVTNNPGSAINPPLLNEVKGRVELSVVIELEDFLNGQQSNDLLLKLEHLFSASRLAGGEIVSVACRLYKEEPDLRGYSLMRVAPGLDETPLETVMRSVAFGRTGYLGEFPIGAVHTGYQAIAPATSYAVKSGAEYPLVRAESIYHLFRYVTNAVLSPDEREWFAPTITQQPTFTLTFCE
jgi:hypothetical protein